MRLVDFRFVVRPEVEHPLAPALRPDILVAIHRPGDGQLLERVVR
jgi:hypothetical protein